MPKINEKRDDTRSPKIPIYLKAACIMAHMIYDKMLMPLMSLLIPFAIVLVPFGEGWLLERIFPSVFVRFEIIGTSGHLFAYWPNIWAVGAICDIGLLLLILLIYWGMRLWLDALREAKKSDSRCGG